MKTVEQLKYPIGEFEKPTQIEAAHIEQWISDIEAFPTRLIALVKDLTAEQLLWPYRPEGWTIQQVVHHCADSHINSIIRFKLSLTEDNPTIKPYFENRWAELPDTLDLPISTSLSILKGLHARWTYLLKSLQSEDLKKGFVHPEHGKQFYLDETIGVYAWHSNHHLAHIEQAIAYQGKFEL